MRDAFKMHLLAAAAFLSAAGWTETRAAVTLDYNAGPPNPNSALVAPGAAFSIPIQLTSSTSTDTVNGLSYQVSSSVNGVVEFLSRMIDPSSPFTFSNAPSTPPAIVLSPANGTDLGAAESDVMAAVPAGTYPVATINFMLLSGAAPGSKITLNFASTAYGHPFPNATSSSFLSTGSFVVTVTPEPASAVVGLALGGVGFARRRRPAVS